MPSVRLPRPSARRALAFAMGIASIFDLTGATIYRTMREVLPPAPEGADQADPFRDALGTIVSAHQDALVAARGEYETEPVPEPGLGPDPEDADPEDAGPEDAGPEDESEAGELAATRAPSGVALQE